MCNKKLRNDLIEGTDDTSDYLGSMKNDGFQQNMQRDLTAVNELVLTIASFEPLRSPNNFRLISRFLPRKPFHVIEDLKKLVFTHSQSRFIKLSNNPSGKKVISLASSAL